MILFVLCSLSRFSLYLHLYIICFVIFVSFPLPPSSPEADDLAQYLDQLLAHAAPKKPSRQMGGGLGRFKAVATKTKEMVSLKHKAQDLDVQSE